MASNDTCLLSILRIGICTKFIYQPELHKHHSTYSTSVVGIHYIKIATMHVPVVSIIFF